MLKCYLSLRGWSRIFVTEGSSMRSLKEPQEAQQTLYRITEAFLIIKHRYGFYGKVISIQIELNWTTRVTEFPRVPFHNEFERYNAALMITNDEDKAARLILRTVTLNILQLTWKDLIWFYVEITDLLSMLLSFFNAFGAWGWLRIRVTASDLLAA